MEIKKVYSQQIPATRFIGKKYVNSDRVNGGFGAKWCEFFEKKYFDIIENSVGKDKISALYEDAGSFIGLMYCHNDEFAYYIGEFTPAGSTVPEGLDYIDFDANTLGVGWVYGKEETGEVYCHEPEVLGELGKAGIIVNNTAETGIWFFERYVCPRFTTPDTEGNIILDICFFVNRI